KAALRVGRAPEAFDFLRRLQEEFPGSDHMQEARLLLGDAHAAAGEIEQAATLYTEVASSAPRTRTDPDVVSEHNRLVATAFTRLARIAFDAGRYTEAAQLLESRLQTATTADGNEQIYMLLAKSYQMEG